MPVYFVTGKLGSGKSLVAVSKIKERLLKGLPVATNLDINLKNMLGRNKKNTRLFRIPDKPTYHDLLNIGTGNKTYDEDLNGLLVLDECGTWFNSRSWADKSRQEVINWFLHARKLGWDIIFLVQDMNIVDKQARLALAEHVVYCKRTDRANIPLVGGIFKLLTGARMPIPKIHLGVVRYGDSPTALKVDTWTTLGPTIYHCYDTKQQFSDFYEHSVYSVLPPYYVYGRYAIDFNWKNTMRMTKIYFKKWSRFAAFALGAAITFSITTYYSDDLSDAKEEIAIVEPVQALKEKYESWVITSYANWPNQLSQYTFRDANGNFVTSSSLRTQGVTLKDRGSCEALIVEGKDYVSIYCN